MAQRKAKLPRGINVREYPNGYTAYEWQVVRHGKRKRESGYATIKEAEAARTAYLRLLEGGADIAAVEMSVADLYEDWHKKYVNVALAANTRVDYELHWRNRIKPVMEHLSVGVVNREIARTVVGKLKDAGTGNRTINKTITTLASMWTYSMETYNFPESNPWHADRTRSRKSSKKLRVAEVSIRPVRPQPIANIYAVAEQMAHPRDRALVLLGLTTGMRLGELLGLLWEDVFADHVIVNGSVSAVLRERKDMTKTVTNPCRTVELMPSGAGELSRWQVIAPDHELVFPNISKGYIPQLKGGKPITREVISASAWTTRILDPAVKAAKVPRFTMQNVRQTYISNMLMAGKAPLWVAEQAGNSPQVIYKHYARYIPALQQGTDLDRFFTPDQQRSA